MTDAKSPGDLKLRDEFRAPSLEAWTEGVEASLKGRPYESLRWRSDDIAIAPVQTAADLEGLPHLPHTAALRGPAEWRIRERIAAASPELAAEHVARALAQDVTEIEVQTDPYLMATDEAALCGVPVVTADDLQTTLAPADLRSTYLAFDGDAMVNLAFVATVAKRAGIALSELRGELGLDPLQDSERDSEAAVEAGWDEASAVVAFCQEHAPGLRALRIDTGWSHDAGGSAAQEVAAAMLEAIEIGRRLAERGHDFATVANHLSFRVPVSTDLLTQIAKLRAMRLLWAKVGAAFTPDGGALIPAHLVGTSSDRCRAHRYDLRTNLLRATTEAVAAALGGCDAIRITPHELHPDYQDTAARDLTRQLHHLLRAEGCLTRVADPTAGSFAVERMTHEIASRAWAIVREIESLGGIPAARGGERLLHQVILTGGERMARRRRRQDVRVGLSQYADPALEGSRERRVDREVLVAAAEQRARAQMEAADRQAAAQAIVDAGADEFVPRLIAAAEAGCTAEALVFALEERWPDEGEDEVAGDHDDHHAFAELEIDEELLVTDAADFEDLRELVSATAPRTLILTYGSGRIAAARGDFAADLFTAGGFAIERTEALRDHDAAVAAIAQHSPELVVACAEDEDLPALCAAVAQLDDRPITVIAGKPRALETEVDGFVFQSGDALLRLDYLAKKVELTRLATAGSENATELRESLEHALDTLQDYLAEEAG